MRLKEKNRINYLKIRIIIVGIFFSIIFSLIGAKAIYVQVFCNDWLSAKASNEYERPRKILGKRGTILDTNSRELAVTNDMTTIVAYPKIIKDIPYTAKSIAGALKLEVSQVENQLKTKNSCVQIKRRINPKEAQAVESLKLLGIGYIPEQSRFYPNKTLAGQVLGFTGADGQGLEGIEFFYDEYLKGNEYSFKILIDGKKRRFDTDNDTDKNNNAGNNVILTIDRNVQYMAEITLEETVNEFSAKSGMAIVMIPKTGAILAVAHYPFFNPNAYKSFDSYKWRNRAITDFFEPGSTMKVFSISAAIESGVCSPSTSFFCENGAYRVGRKIVKDTHSYGWLTIQQIIKYSSNIGAIKVGETLGSKYLYNYLKSYGFGSKTEIDSPAETSGMLASYSRWTKIDSGCIAFGHGISVSAIQIITAACAIANDGILMKPHLVKAITDPNGRIIKEFGHQQVRKVLSPETAKVMRQIMKTVIQEGGTGVKANIEGYTVCGKTGTAQVPNPNGGGYARGKYISSFLGIAPADNPEIAVLVIINEPQNEYYASTVAAPAFRKIAYETLQYLNIEPEIGEKLLTTSKKPEENG